MPGETEGNLQDVSSGGESGTTSQAETFTKEQVDQLLSDAKAEKGRETATWKRTAEDTKRQFDSLQQQLKEKEATLTELRQARDDDEWEKVKDEPEERGVFKKSQSLRQKELDLNQQERTLKAQLAELEARMKTFSDREKEGEARRIAAANPGVEVEDLLRFDVDEMETWAKKLAKPSPQESPKESVQPDTGATIGGAGKPTQEQLESMSMDEYARVNKERFK